VKPLAALVVPSIAHQDFQCDAPVPRSYWHRDGGDLAQLLMYIFQMEGLLRIAYVTVIAGLISISAVAP
jgi:hypothetical protein